MKTLKFIAALACVTITGVFTAKAQSDQATIGIKAGLTLSQIGNYEYNYSQYSSSFKPGFQAGLYAYVPLGRKVIFMPHAMYTQKGANLKVVGLTGNSTTEGDIDMRMNYFDLPVLFAYKLHPKLNVYAGPQMSLLISQSTTVKLNGQPTVTNTNTAEYRKTLFGGNFGVSYNLSSNVNLNIGHAFDLSRATSSAADPHKLKNNVTSFSVGYTF